VVIDNDFAVWRSFQNRFWPAIYLIDGDGFLCFHHFGEGSYEEIEREIQRLLGVDEPPVRVEATGVAEAADWDTLETPETYVGRLRGERRTDASELAINEWALIGDWSVGDESAVLEAPGGRIAYRFQARDLNLVLTGAARFEVRLDGRPPGDARGVDVDSDGHGVVDEPRMYQLVRQPGAVAARTFEITFHGAGVRAFVFTFG
jgi:hypothetical protein